MPILPMVLVNGSDGIGTGWSSAIPNYNPVDIVANLRRKMRGEPIEPIHPWFRGFKVSWQQAFTKTLLTMELYRALSSRTEPADIRQLGLPF